MPTYRRGQLADVPVLAQLWHDMLIESLVSGSGFVEDWRARLEAHFTAQIEAGNAAWFLAEEAGHVIGTAAAFLSRNNGEILLDVQATIAGIYVVPAHRRQGIARELTQRAIDWCKEQGCVRMRLQASQAGRPLYESLGFRTFDEMMKLDVR